MDLDLGNYERFEDVTLTRDHNITTGKIYHEVMTKERRGDYLGKTVQVVPHVTDEIQVCSLIFFSSRMRQHGDGHVGWRPNPRSRRAWGSQGMTCPIG